MTTASNPTQPIQISGSGVQAPEQLGIIHQTSESDDQTIYPEDNNIKYSTDMQGNILAPLTTFDGAEVYSILLKKIEQPPETWVRRVKVGLVVYFADSKPARGKVIPEFLSFTDCIDIVSMMVLNHFEIPLPVGKTLSDPLQEITKQIPSETDLEFYSRTMKLLCILQKVCPKREKLLPNSPSTRVIIRYISTRIMTEAMAWIEDIAVRNVSSPPGEEFALHAFLNSAGLLNQFVEIDLEESNTFAKKLEAMPPQDPIPMYPYLWVNTVYLNYYSARCLAWLAQSVIVALRHNVNNQNETQREGDDSMDVDGAAAENSNAIPVLYWKCIDTAATLFYGCCFVHQFVHNLVANPHCEQLLLAIEKILQIPSDAGPHVLRAKYYLLRVMVVLAENDEPYFLDYASKMKTSFNIARLAAREASQVLHLVSNVQFVSEDVENPTLALVAREAFRVTELLSYDSSFVKLVTETMTLFILEYLSVSPNVFTCYFEVTGSFPQYNTALLFRMIANLHCYNPQVSPPDQKHFLINKIYYYFTTILVPTPEGKICCTSKVIIGNIATNLWILFHKVTELFNFTLQELELWRSFMGELQQALNLVFPPPQSVGGKPAARKASVAPKPRAPRPIDDEYITESDPDEDLEDDADEFVLAPTVKPATLKDSLPPTAAEASLIISLSGPDTKILEGLIVCLAVVPDPESLKALVKKHGGTVIGYVTKSVTHVICGHDTESVIASESKIQSAAAKQVPAVSEKLIHDSLKEGRLLNEKPYLVANHSYLRRVKC